MLSSSLHPHAHITAQLRAAGCVFAEQEAQLLTSEAKTPSDLDVMVRRRIAGQRLEHILGWAEFCGQRIAVGPGVFVPRHRTELLVRQAIALARPQAVVVDLCCGSGALGVVVAAELNQVELYAADVDPVAVRCARHNVAAFGGHVYQGDLFSPLPAKLKGRIDILMANVPYVPTEDIEFLPREARIHEPRVALDGGIDGLDLLRRVAAEAPGWLALGGHILTETGTRQAVHASEVFTRNGLASKIVSSDELEATVVIGTSPLK